MSLDKKVPMTFANHRDLLSRSQSGLDWIRPPDLDQIRLDGGSCYYYYGARSILSDHQTTHSLPGQPSGGAMRPPPPTYFKTSSFDKPWYGWAANVAISHNTTPYDLPTHISTHSNHQLTASVTSDYLSVRVQLTCSEDLSPKCAVWDVELCSLTHSLIRTVLTQSSLSI